MSTSILTSTKKALGIEEDQTHFDETILLHINSIVAVLTQVGIGPAEGIYVEDASTNWDDLYGTDNRKNMVRSYIVGKVRLLFDAPQTSYHVESIKEIVAELEWRLNVVREETEWTDPTPPVVLPDEEW